MTDKDIQQTTGAILTSFVALHYLEEIKHQPHIKHSVKNNLNRTIKDLQQIEKQFFDKVDEIDDKEIADKLSANLMSFIKEIMKGKMFQDFATIQEILMAFSIEPKAIKGISDKVLLKNNATLIKG